VSKLLIIALIMFLIWAMWRGKSERRAVMTLDEARAVLGVPIAADAGEVHAAYRRLTARVHPDAGGSPELARRVKSARDILVADLARRPPAL
jgi:hypothetical protein